jgi:hypothetical protein
VDWGGCSAADHPGSLSRPHTISATSRPAQGDRELVETPPKTRLLPARHVVCALLPEKSTVSHFICLAGRPWFGYSVTWPPYSSSTLYQARRPPAGISYPHLHSLTTFHSFRSPEPSALPGCSPLVPVHDLFNRAYPRTAPPTTDANPIQPQHYTRSLFVFFYTTGHHRTGRYSAAADILAQSNCKSHHPVPCRHGLYLNTVCRTRR